MTDWVTVWVLLRTEWQYHCCNDSKTSGMKGGPACGSERDITGKSARRSPYFIIPLSFLIGDRGRRGVSSDKARQFQELLCRQITAVHHAALCLSLRLLPQLLHTLIFLRFAPCADEYVDLGSCWPQLWSGDARGRSWEAGKPKERTTAPSRECFPSLNAQVESRWSSDALSQ